MYEKKPFCREYPQRGFLYHIAAYIAILCRCQVAVVALFQGYADFVCYFKFELLHCRPCFWHVDFVAVCIVVAHVYNLLVVC